MSKFQLFDPEYGTKYWRRNAIYKDNIAYHFKEEDNLYMDYYIYLNNTEVAIRNIIFSIEIYYYTVLKKYIECTKEDFEDKFNTCQKSITELYQQLGNNYEKNKQLINSIDNQICAVISSKNIFDKKLNIDNILQNEICFDNILYDLYECELSKIDKYIFNTNINITDEIITIEEDKMLYLTNDTIIREMYISESLMEDIKNLLCSAIEEYIYTHDNYNKESMKQLCKCLDILLIVIHK